MDKVFGAKITSLKQKEEMKSSNCQLIRQFSDINNSRGISKFFSKHKRHQRTSKADMSAALPYSLNNLTVFSFLERSNTFLDVDDMTEVMISVLFNLRRVFIKM